MQNTAEKRNLGDDFRRKAMKYLTLLLTEPLKHLLVLDGLAGGMYFSTIQSVHYTKCFRHCVPSHCLCSSRVASPRWPTRLSLVQSGYVFRCPGLKHSSLSSVLAACRSIRLNCPIQTLLKSCYYAIMFQQVMANWMDLKLVQFSAMILNLAFYSL